MRVLGLITFDDPETSLWRPFGSRRIEHVTHDDSAEALRLRRVEFVLVDPSKLELFFHQAFQDWAAQMNAEILGKVTLPLRASSIPADWFLVRLPPAKPK